MEKQHFDHPFSSLRLEDQITNLRRVNRLFGLKFARYCSLCTLQKRMHIDRNSNIC